MAKLLKIPVARMGSWFHETMGVISFSGDDLRALESNFRGNVRGYEPYLKTGHNEKGPGIYDGEEAEAHMVDMVREGDVLFGLFEPHNEEVVDAIDRQAYRYASAELIRSAKDRETGKPISGPILRGIALTNTPNIPNLPRNSLVDSDSLTYMLSDDLVREVIPILMSPADGVLMSSTTPAPETPAPDAAAEAASVVADAPVAETPSMLASIQEAITAGFKAIADTFKAPEAAVVAAVAETEKTAEELAADAEAAAASVIAATEAAAAELAKTAEQLALEAELATLREAAAVAEAARIAAEAKTAELEAEKAALTAQSEADAATAQEASEAAAAQEAARKEGEYTQMLSDRVADYVTRGVTPLEANKAKELVLALKSSVTSVMLSDREAPIDLVDAVFELLSDRVGTIDFGQAGAVDAQAGKATAIPDAPAAKGMSPGNPWAKRRQAA